jgi:predicted dehydrogenase
VGNDEPLRLECRHFIACVREGSEPRSGGEVGLRVVRVLEQLQRSLDLGSPVEPVAPS